MNREKQDSNRLGVITWLIKMGDERWNEDELENR
jgi:hypothetical protein